MFLSLGMLVSSPTHLLAGIYNPGESDEVVAIYPDFMDSPTNRNFRSVLITLQTIPGTTAQVDDVLRPQRDNPVRQRYEFLDDMITRSAVGFKTPEEWLQASAVLIRRHKYDKARDLLRPIAGGTAERDNFLLQSNFATALHGAGDLQGAYQTLREAIKTHWPAEWDALPHTRRQFVERRLGWDEELYRLYRLCDTHYLTLLRLRLRERVTKKEGKGPVQPPDALFDDGKDPPTPVRFVAESGEFEAGRIAAAEYAKLPAKALPIVQQLLVWLPDDRRLFWLLGELYNAQKAPTGKENRDGVRAALRIFEELSATKPLADDVQAMLNQRIAALKEATARYAREDEEKLLQDLKDTKKGKAGDDAAFVVDWRTVGVSFITGFLLALGIVWQVREIRRRMARQAGRPPSG